MSIPKRPKHISVADFKTRIKAIKRGISLEQAALAPEKSYRDQWVRCPDHKDK